MQLEKEEGEKGEKKKPPEKLTSELLTKSDSLGKLFLRKSQGQYLEKEEGERAREGKKEKERKGREKRKKKLQGLHFLLVFCQIIKYPID